MMTEIEKIKAEIDPKGMRRMHGYELHALIDRAAKAAIEDCPDRSSIISAAFLLIALLAVLFAPLPK